MISLLVRLFLVGFILSMVISATMWMVPYIIVGYVAVYAYQRYQKRETSL
jgi:uncharacterized membrane protein YciS (DUF1049 family)